ncbi:translation initiation factor IF-3 [Paenibacillus sp. OV219]|uniref:translation initiation factor IF-3 n=1 Tax=Paenibacillus sp. OV219 TaxID=1884377 RepID=UPI0008C92A78|nr:translation initiation factor IF-3 [Paenibacillus sp. OV219]SEO38555.1 bacterial translation initiation factor 3 (bIF-3) [Paenibacillus sp. OV219]
MLIMDEKIKASEVLLTGLDGEDLGIVSREEALRMAKERGVSLVCTSLMSSPPPCKLISKGAAKQDASAQKREEKKKDQPLKAKEIRLTPHIEDHDYDTKLRQCEKLLASGNAVDLVVRIQGKEGAKAKELLEQLVKDLAGSGKKETGIQLSGKQAAVKLLPL